MAKLNWLKRAINTQHTRFQNDYAGQMGVKHREALAQEMKEFAGLTKEVEDNLDHYGAILNYELIKTVEPIAEMPPDPRWLDVVPRTSKI